MAERIVAHFGQATLEVIEQAPGRLVEVPGPGPKRTAMITAAWAEQQAIREVMVFLQGMGVSTSLGGRIYKSYRDEAIDVVRREPYRLAADVWGIGFKTADTIAQRLGIPHDSPQRVKAGLQFALSQATEDGHCYLPETELVAKATGLLEVEDKLCWAVPGGAGGEEGVVAAPRQGVSGPSGGGQAGRSGWSPFIVPRLPWPPGCCACSTHPSTGCRLSGGGLDSRAGLASSEHRHDHGSGAG
jgi:exodeoxyribonuclease V alpha subunit